MANPTPFDELTDKRKKVVKALAATESEFTGRERYADGEFARSQANAVFYQNDLTAVIGEGDDENQATLQVTTDLLNKIQEENGWLEKTQQGGETAFVIDTGATPADERVTGVTPAQLSTLAHQVLDRHEMEMDLSHVDFSDWQEVLTVVNQAVGKRVLMVKSEPNLYRLTEQARDRLADA